MPSASDLYEEGLEAARNGDHERALNCLTSAVEQDGQAEYYAALGNLYAVQGDSDNALFFLKQACELDVTSAEHRSDIAGVLFNKGEFRDAIHFYQEAVEGDPTNPEHFYRLGCAFYFQAQPNYERARAAFRQAAALYPTNPVYQRQLGLACQHLEDYAEAADALRASARLGSSPDVEYNLACALYGQGEFAEAAEAAYRALDENEEEWEPRIVRLWARALHRSEQWGKALNALSLAVILEPHDARLFELHGDTLLKLGHFEQAARSYQKAALLLPDRADLHYHCGTAFLQGGDPERGRQALEKALDLRADYGDALNNLALCQDVLGARVEALDSVRKALALAPEKAEYLATLARLEGDPA